MQQADIEAMILRAAYMAYFANEYSITLIATVGFALQKVQPAAFELHIVRHIEPGQ
jgi:hypothetical protein